MSRPYFETKVVKVKKVKKEWTPDCCPCCGAKREAEKPLGNWVNGENLDKIKFPCFCRWSYNNTNHIGMISKTNTFYTLLSLDSQTTHNNEVDSSMNSRTLIITYKIHILKAKITLFEEE